MAPAYKPQPEDKAQKTDVAFDPDLSQTDFEIEFYGRILRRYPDHLEVVRRQAELLARQGKFEQAVELDQRLVQLEPENCFARYNLACSLARLGKASEAMATLQQAVQLGYCDFAHLASDPDLTPLHTLPAFQKIARRGRSRI